MDSYLLQMCDTFDVAYDQCAEIIKAVGMDELMRHRCLINVHLFYDRYAIDISWKHGNLSAAEFAKTIRDTYSRWFYLKPRMAHFEG